MITARTWEQQKTYEMNVRKRWLEALAASGCGPSEAARYAGLDRASLTNMGKKHGVTFQTKRTIKAEAEAEAARKKAEAAKRSKAEKAVRKTISERTEKLMAEGFTRQQAIRAVAHQMGVPL